MVISSMRVVIDTDVLLRGLRSAGGASRIILIAVMQGVVRPIANVSMILEYEAVLKRPDNLRATGLTSAEVDAFLDDWCYLSDPVMRLAPTRPRVRDPDDAAFADAAVAGVADALVTFNIAVYRMLEPPGGSLPVEVMRPCECLRRLAWRPEAMLLSAFRRP